MASFLVASAYFYAHFIPIESWCNHKKVVRGNFYVFLKIHADVMALFQWQDCKE